jgi:hypothetical protein
MVEDEIVISLPFFSGRFDQSGWLGSWASGFGSLLGPGKAGLGVGLDRTEAGSPAVRGIHERRGLLAAGNNVTANAEVGIDDRRA